MASQATPTPSTPSVPGNVAPLSRTRSSTRNSQPLTPALSKTQITQAIGSIVVGQSITTTWRQLPDPDLITTKGTCVRRDQSSILVLYEDNLGVQPLPQTREDVDIFKIVPHPLSSIPLPPLNAINRDNTPTNPVVVVYVDGGARPSNGGPAAAAITIASITNGNLLTQHHARFFAAGTNNGAELSSSIGGLRYIERHHPNDDTLLITDSFNNYKYMIGESSCKTTALKPLFDIACNLFRSRVAKTTIAHMLRVHGNLADPISTRCISTAQDVGDATLFPDIPFVHAKPRFAPQPPTLHPTATVELPVITSVDDFAKTRRFKSRLSCPTHCGALWGLTVQRQLEAILLASNTTSRDEGITQLLLLPTAFLPANIPSNRIHKNLELGKPFALSTTSTPQRQVDPEVSEADKRLAEAVERLALDRRLRSANKLISTVANSSELSFEEKCSKLAAKLVTPDEDEPRSHIPHENVPAISGGEVVVALRKINRQSACSIDGWTKDLLYTAIVHNPNVADSVAAVLRILISEPLSQLLQDIITAGRIVGIPKPQNPDGSDAGIRPIVIANIWLKLLGSIMMARDSTKCNPQQYGVGAKDGCLTIIHQIRAKLAENPDNVATKFDISNAFNATSRRRLQQFIMNRHPVMTRQYYRLAYAQACFLVAFGADEHLIMKMLEGIRQGDSTSSYFFCLAVDIVLSKLKSLGIDCWMYMDDLTVVCHRNKVEEIKTQVKDAFTAIGLTVNSAKTQVFDPMQPGVQRPFILLGADLAATPLFARKKLEEQNKYITRLLALPLHPQLAMCLLRLCGSPRITYVARAMHPLSIAELTVGFDKSLREALLKILHLDSINNEAYHDALGAGIPCYAAIAPTLYSTTKTNSLSTCRQQVMPEAASRASYYPAQHNLDAHYLFYNPDAILTPAEFLTTFSIRLGTLPPHLRIIPSKCDCGHFIIDERSQITHALKCDVYTTQTHTIRHNFVRDAMIAVASAYGITCSREPSVYVYSAGKRRPDVLFHTPQPIVTDITVVYPDDQPGHAAEKADLQKKETHTDAAKRLGHLFVPSAFEAYGAFGENSSRLISLLAQQLPPTRAFDFRRDMQRAISHALARGRAAAIFGIRQRRDGVL